MENISKVLAKNIKAELRNQERSMSWLGRQIGTSGADVRAVLNKLNSNKGSITVRKLERMANVLGKDIVFFFSDIGNKKVT